MRELLPLLPRPSRYAGIEQGACHKDPAHTSLRVALAFPDTYEVGMSYLGQKILYSIVNARENWWAERVMAPEREAGEILRKHNAPLSTLESDTPLAKMQAICFSITHELCYTNLLYMLDLAHLPLHADARGAMLCDNPIVIAGGGAVLSAEPLAPYVDLMALGDGEEILPEILELLEKGLALSWTRRHFLEQVRLIPGVYVPCFFIQDDPFGLKPLFVDHARPARRIVADLNQTPYPSRQVLPVGAVHNRLSLEIARGCTRGCRFCHAGIVYRPARERNFEEITLLLKDCIAQTGFEELSFLSLSSGDFSALKSLCTSAMQYCREEQVSLSLPSLRVGSIDDEILERIAGIRRTGLTLAPEAGSQRLRNVINKGVSEEDLLLHAQKLLEHGWRQVKLYFMIGLPTETDADLEAIFDLCVKVRDAGGRGAPRLAVTASISPFVPKPFTPFQWEEQIGLEEIERRVRMLRGLFKNKKGLTLRWHEPAMSHLEGIFARAGRELAPVVEKAYRKGAVFCDWAENFSLRPWLEALDECGLAAETLIGPRELDRPLPWSHLEVGVSEEFLLRERNRALAEKITPDCRYAACQNCGACDRGSQASRLAHSSRLAHKNRLNFQKRDQELHQANRDAEGRLILRKLSQERPKLSPLLARKAVRYRLWHSKAGGCAFLSQLELQALLGRALRRAQIPMSFSQGFHPMPLLSFGRALPVGVKSEAEWFTLTLCEILSPAKLKERLAPELPSGLEILALEQIESDRRIEQSQAEGFQLGLAGDLNFAEVRRAFFSFMTSQSFPYTHQGKTGLRTVDLRQFLRSLSIDEQSRRLDFIMDWSEAYFSPLLIALAVLAPLAPETDLRLCLKLKKHRQIFASGRSFPD